MLDAESIAIATETENSIGYRPVAVHDTSTFKNFVSVANPRFVFYEHCNLLAGICEKIAAGDLKRVMIFMPPRHGKSELFSRLFSAYYLSRNPHHFVGINSYSAELAYTLSRASRENYLECGGQVRDDAAAVKHWETPQGGGLWAAGVGGSITGKGFHLGIIDDPLKNAEEALSPVIREKQKEWYNSTFYTRQEPDAAVAVISTRWHEDDLSGWLLAMEAEGEDPEAWTIISLPAISEPEVTIVPTTCTLVPDFRGPGEPLCPERYPLAKLQKIRNRIGGYYFDALYQQQPTSKAGSFFHVDRLEIVPTAPIEAARVRGWDMGATADDGDPTSGVKLCRDRDDIIYIEDVVWGQWDTAARNRTIRQTAELDGDTTHQIGEQEPGSGGKAQAEAFVKGLQGFPVFTESSTSNKEVRADPYSAQVNAGNVKLVAGDWNKGYIEELRQFPRGKHDDRVDASSLGFNYLTKRHVPIRRMVGQDREDLVPEHLRLTEIAKRAPVQSEEQTSREIQTHDAIASLAEMLRKKDRENENGGGHFSL